MEPRRNEEHEEEERRGERGIGRCEVTSFSPHLSISPSLRPSLFVFVFFVFFVVKFFF